MHDYHSTECVSMTTVPKNGFVRGEKIDVNCGDKACQSFCVRKQNERKKITFEQFHIFVVSIECHITGCCQNVPEYFRQESFFFHFAFEIYRWNFWMRYEVFIRIGFTRKLIRNNHRANLWNLMKVKYCFFPGCNTSDVLNMFTKNSCENW